MVLLFIQEQDFSDWNKAFTYDSFVVKGRDEKEAQENAAREIMNRANSHVGGDRLLVEAKEVCDHAQFQSNWNGHEYTWTVYRDFNIKPTMQGKYEFLAPVFPPHTFTASL